MKPEQNINISTRTFFKAVLFILGLWFLWYVRDIVAMLVAAVMLASLIDPFADWFAKRRIPRGLAVLIVYTVLVAITSIIVILLIPVVIEQSAQLLSNLSISYLDLTESFGQFRAFSESHGLGENLQSTLASFQNGINTSIRSVFSTVKGFFGSITSLLIVLVLAFYMVSEENSLRKYFKSFAPIEYQPYIAQLLTKMQKKIGAWLRGQIILGFIVGIAVYIGLKLLGVEYALLLALIAGIFEIVPYVGPILALIPAAIIGFADSVFIGIAIVILYLVIQQIENNLLVPKVMQKVTGLNPIISIIALLVGIKVAGLIGAILAIPLATMIGVATEDFFKEMR
jgi:predicted PurR-regulated permease PerM